MEREIFRSGNMLYPVPAVLVSVRDGAGRDNLITIAWTGTVCSDPAMTYISVKPERYSHHILQETGEFVINLVPRRLAKELDFCGVKSGRDVDKFEACGLTRLAASTVGAPLVAECPVGIECRVDRVIELGSHDMFLAKVLSVSVDRSLMDKTGRLDLARAELITYSHGEYFSPGQPLGRFGFSVRKRVKR